MTRSNASPFKLREHPEISVGESLTYQTRTVVGPPISLPCKPHGDQADLEASESWVVARSEPDICAVPAFIMRIRGISDLGATLFDGKAPTMINSQLPCSHTRGDPWGFRGPQRPRLRGKGNAKPDRNLQSPSLYWLDRVSPFSTKCWILPNAVRGNSSVKIISRGTLKRASCEPACAVNASASSRTPGRLIT